jgi:D-aspartate ligase
MNSVFILGSHINALGIVRSFQSTKIKVVILDFEKNLAGFSRYAHFIKCPHPSDKKRFTEFIKKQTSNEILKPVLFITTDVFLNLVIDEFELLKELFHLPLDKAENLRQLLKKDVLYPLAEKLGVSCPKTFIVKNKSDLDLIPEKLHYPIIVKPSLNIRFGKVLGEKAFKLKHIEDFRNITKKIILNELWEDILIFQEFIDGDVTDLYTITSYANKESEIIGYSIGHKIRQNPPETGTIISGKVIHEEEILEEAKSFIKKTSYYGLSNIEFKRDKKDNKFKLMEINPRTGAWNLSALSCGINLPLMFYKDVTGIAIKPEFNHSAIIIWLITPIDFYYSLIGFKRKGFSNFHLSFKEWLKSIKGKKVDACFNWHDPMPFFVGLIKKFS